VDVPRYLRLIVTGKYAEALAVIRESIPFPAICGYVCPAPCELKCQLAGVTDAPEAIRVLKRFVADQASGERQDHRPAPSTGKRVAVVGSGPAGLTAAYYLTLQGHRPTVFEALSEPGGMMRTGIPAYRLPRAVLDAEIEGIKKAGIEIKTGIRIESLDGLLGQGYDAAFVAVGAHRGIRMGIAGEESPWVIDALSFLREIHLGKPPAVGKSVAVVGGGNSAVDAARTALRLGAEEVTIVYRRGRVQMRAYPEEITEAIREGVKIVFMATPSRISAQGGRLRMVCLRTKSSGKDPSAPPQPIQGSEFVVEVETVIVAVGQEPEIPKGFCISLEGKTIRIDPDGMATSRPGVFAGADCVTGPRSVIEAIAAGRKAAIAIDRYLGGRGIIEERRAPSEEVAPPVAKGYPPPTAIRNETPLLSVAERFSGFPLVELGLSPESACLEADRCLKCDLSIKAEASKCRSCFICQLVCSLRFEGAFDTSRAAIAIQPETNSDSDAEVRISFTEQCDGCGLCIRYCPFGALTRGTSGKCGEGKTGRKEEIARPAKEASAAPAHTVGGYAGKILRVDLTNERITEEIWDEATLRKWVGGVGFGAKVLYEEVPPGVQWDDPANRLIVAGGPFGGTMMGGSATISFSAKGCLTHGATSTQANGRMGAFMKSSGADAVIFEGIAKRWLYLYIHDGTAELRDAAHLLGKDTWETEDKIKAELGYSDRQMSVFCIGPAGENLVKYAGIFGDKDHCAGHNGIGAVMGVKKLKAICAPLGRTPIKVASPKKLLPMIETIWHEVQKDPGGKKIFNYGTAGSYETGEQRVAGGTLPVKNYLTNLYPEARLMTCQYVRERWNAVPKPCWACGSHHCHMVTITDGPYRGMKVEEPEYEMFAAWGPLVGNTDPAETLVMSNLLTLLGLEGNEAGFITSMVIELYEKGVLTKEDTGGLELTWGNNKAIRTLLERITRREGPFAAMLAEGIRHAAESLGEEAKKCAVYTMKGHAPRGHDHRAFWRELFDTATSDIGTYSSSYLGPADPDTHSLKDRFSPEQVSTHIAKTKGRRQFEDALGVCNFCVRSPMRFLLEAFNSITGWDFTVKEAQDVGLRVANLMRAFNLRHGMGADLEKPSPRWGSTPVDGPAKGISIAPHWEGMLDNYYCLMGWDRKTGRPCPETLRALGLDFVVADLWPDDKA